MKIGDKHYRTIWLADDGWSVKVIDQTFLPHQFEVMRLTDVAETALAISSMVVRGAPLIGATAAYGMALSANADPSDQAICSAHARLLATRPTAVNLRWALDDMRRRILAAPENQRRDVAYARAADICDDDVATCQGIANHGCQLIEEVFKRKDSAGPVNILTHCNAGALATAGYGTALGIIRAAAQKRNRVSVWVPETRPYLQGSRLTAWELTQEQIPMTLITDNMIGYFMQKGEIDCVVVGTDRTAANGDVANKIGTYTSAVLAARHGIPFYVAAPTTSIDLDCASGEEIAIEQRAAKEITHLAGHRIAPSDVRVKHPAFDVTPTDLVTAIITENGIARAPFSKSLPRIMGLS